MANRIEGGEGFWRGEVERQGRSGESVRGYCGRRGLAEYSFYYWRRRLACESARASGPAFVPVRVIDETDRPGNTAERSAEGAQTGVMEILLGNDRRVRVTGPVDRESLSAVLAVVEGLGC